MPSKLLITLMAFLSINVIWRPIMLCEGRYLPTRSQEDRLLRLRELVQELLKSEEKNVSQMSNGYVGVEDMPADEGYPIIYENGDIDPQIARRFYRPQRVATT